MPTLTIHCLLRASAVAGAIATLVASPARSQVVISQIYGGGGNSGALLQNDFIELFNRGSNTVTLSGWTVQYAPSTSANWQVVPLTSSLEPGQYHLVQLASGGANGLPLPSPDSTGTLNLSATAGKIALVTSNFPLTGTCPVAVEVIDLVGYGTAANCFEGAAPARAPSASVALFRANGGCVDMDRNDLDFFTTAPAPRNRSSALNNCFAPPNAIALHDIQGDGLVSPLAGNFITTTTNIVTGIHPDGFFIQTADAEADDNPASSEAVFVFTPDGLAQGVTIGNAVVVEGTVEELNSGDSFPALRRTQLINATATVIATGATLPAAVSLGADDLRPDRSIDQLERFEGMRVRLDAVTVSGATEGFLIESSATGISDGMFQCVLGSIPRPFREPGISIFEPLPSGAPLAVPRWDANPEALRVDSNAQPGALRLDLVAGAVVSNLVGVLHFEQGAWTLLPDAGSAPVISGNHAATALPEARTNELTVASFNLQRFFDSVDDPDVDETVLTAGAFNGRLNKASLTIRNILREPDILGVIEMENLATLQALAAKLNADALSLGRPSPGYAAWLEEGNDIGGIDIGFLVRTSRVSVIAVTQLGKDATYVNPADGQPATLNDRPPLVLRAAVPRLGFTEPLPVTVILNHLRSLSGIDGSSDGARIRAKRRAQAEHLAQLVQERQTALPPENLVVLGDFNAFQFNDGYVDVLGTIMGTPTPTNEVTLASADLVNPDLVNVTAGLPPSERYSFSFDGNAQALDHLLVSASLGPRVARIAYARSNTDFPENFRSNFNRPERISDHDAPIVWLALALPPHDVTITPPEDGEVTLRWIAEPGQNCRVEASSDLQTWTQIGMSVTEADGNAAFTEPSAAEQARRFYRITAW